MLIISYLQFSYFHLVSLDFIHFVCHTTHFNLEVSVSFFQHFIQLTFGQNTLKETNAFQLVIDNKEDLSGLPEDVIVKAAQTAQENGLDGKWVGNVE